jgi:hypothetical protein
MNALANRCPGVRLIGISTIAFVLLQCSRATGRDMECYIGFLNKTGRSLDEVSVYSGNKLWGLPKPLVVGGEATEGVITMATPTEAEVRINDHGEQKSVKVSLKDVPKDFHDGTIYFVFNRDGTVQAKALKDDDTSGYAKLIEGLRPRGEYRFAFVNRTGRDLQAVSVYYGGQKAGTGNDIPARARANFSYSDPLTTPLLAEAELRWTEDSTPHAVTVNLEGVPKGFEGRIFLVMRAGGTVEVYPVKNGDDKAAFELVK